MSEQASAATPTLAAAELAECDVVMKGGITSGVVYPLAVVELAKKYRFKNVGGASAGAIAAALTAAAELGRERGAFAELERAARGLGARLRGLFQPSPQLRPLFEALMGLAAGKGTLSRVDRLLGVAARWYPGAGLLGLAPALGLLALGATTEGGWGLGLAALLVAFVGLPLALLLRLLKALRSELPASNFGLCPGTTQPGFADPALIDWLADLLDDLAGIPRTADGRREKPLTFGDLWQGEEQDAAIRLRMMTSNLTSGRPHALPFEGGSFFFRPEELARLFPERVVTWMMAHSESYILEPAFQHLPAPKDLPVIVAVRMSLAFPLLFEAVPLYGCDYTFKEETERHKPRRAWFSDGGICSNFPIHFFDELWPKRPTFGITLEEWSEERHSDRVWLPIKAGQGLLRNFRAVESLGGFVGSIVDTMQEWQDNLQSTLPGYRERIVHVRLAKEEGGLNLDMDPEVIERLLVLGTQAGQKLNDEFVWEMHRWIRCLSSMAETQGSLAGLDPATVDFVASRDVNRNPYKQAAAWQGAAAETLAGWQQAAAAEPATKMAASKHLPNPRPQVRLMPRL